MKSTSQRRFLCIGSINIDHVYKCDRIVGIGESLPTRSYERHLGGKGLNQAFGLYTAGIKDLLYFGIVGEDGRWMLKELTRRDFPIDNILVHPHLESGHTIIQLDKQHGDNAVILHFGANHSFTPTMIDDILNAHIRPGDVLLIQGETNELTHVIRQGKKLGAIVVFNAAPYPPLIKQSWRDEYPVDWLFVNRGEALAILGKNQANQSQEVNKEELLEELLRVTGIPNIILTLGALGSVALVPMLNSKGNGKTEMIVKITVAAIPTTIADTTGAGDVYASYFLAHYFNNSSPDDDHHNKLKKAMEYATCGASLAVSRMGALSSIPTPEEVQSLYDCTFKEKIQSLNGSILP